MTNLEMMDGETNHFDENWMFFFSIITSKKERNPEVRVNGAAVPFPIVGE